MLIKREIAFRLFTCEIFVKAFIMQVLLLQNVEGIFSYIKTTPELYRIDTLIHNFALNNSVYSPELTSIQETFCNA